MIQPINPAIRHHLETVIFDLGNVLIRVDPSDTIRRLAGVSPPVLEQDIIRIFTQSEFVQLYEKGMITGPEFYHAVKQALGFSISQSRFKRLWQHMFSPIWPMVRFVDAIRGAYRLVILSNTNAWHIEYCEKKFAFMQWFPFRLYSHELGLAKPDPAIYIRALEISGAVPEKTLFIDDREENTAAAGSLGMQVIRFNGPLSFIYTWAGRHITANGKS
ncbi:HAD family phosphatase [bacterium]|nr:HAD family phosphatase [bacterium]